MRIRNINFIMQAIPMKQILLFVALFGSLSFAQRIGEIAPAKESITFPSHSYGVDIMFSEGGFGLGTFYRQALTRDLNWFADFSISEAKDANEVEYYDYWGNSYVAGKLNRVFLLPLFVGLQYRLFADDIGDNLRPYICIAAGPSTVMTTPYDREFFNSFRKAQAQVTAGGYIGFGANFGLDQKSLMGVSIRYYVTHFFNDGVQSLEGVYEKNLGGLYISINIGSMY
jgi:hypothetical protein